MVHDRENSRLLKTDNAFATVGDYHQPSQTADASDFCDRYDGGKEPHRVILMWPFSLAAARLLSAASCNPPLHHRQLRRPQEITAATSRSRQERWAGTLTLPRGHWSRPICCNSA